MYFRALLWIFKALCAGFLLCALASCATMNVDECRAADWRGIGQRDALAGRTLSVLDERAKDCAKAQVIVNTQDYLQGRDVGLQTYCQLPNAIRLGVDGMRYDGVCPVALDAEFRKRYNAGRDVYRASSRLDELENIRRRLEGRLRELPAGAAGDKERESIRHDLYDLDRDFYRTRRRVGDAELVLRQF